MDTEQAKHNDRIIGTYTGHTKGTLLLVTAAVHGNEPSGVLALEEIFKTLKKENPPMAGTLVGIVGNVAAYKNNVRFIDEDLNRTWTTENLKTEATDTQEKKEMHQLIELLEDFETIPYTNRYFIDCHTTSSESLPYISVQDKGDNDFFAHKFPIHVIRGFSDMVEGTIDGYLSEQGITGFTVEAGQHESKSSKTYHEGVIWTALQEACELNFDDLRDIPASVLKLMNSTPPQKTLEIVHRFGLKESDVFEMCPGFENFQPIKKGEHLALLNGRQINSVWDAYIFMPLYQSQGNDGFFVVREVSSL
ncbi:M14 family metallopeptidase [Marinirhabdus gelatinilytica]|uniref:Succinylglutamate desuccinylase n=1 Tax=Marinirhabdus gelatinilytica TaxID=1703343 RepID=A0A370QFZ3_9FLAO|nr:succinylglutamate desuccinylase/aspartoacylase family protein [Marinirhabdus gelatinilytica]RDK87286.1 succinylglutamate desuccinylase [Marinirhabdus gelatinilytica]